LTGHLSSEIYIIIFLNLGLICYAIITFVDAPPLIPELTTSALNASIKIP